MTGREVTVAQHVSAPPEVVWQLVCDIDVLPRYSAELQYVAWVDADAPRLGARFTGTNVHPLMGEWTTRCEVIAFDPPRVFAWAVGDCEKPAATWRFDLTPSGTTTLLRYTARIGPGRSGVSMLIERQPHQRDAIVAHRLRQFEAGMTATVNGIKALAEAR